MTVEVDHCLFLALGLTLFIGCGAASNPVAPVPVTPAPLAAGDINPDTASLTAQGPQRTLLLAPYLQQRVLGSHNVSDRCAMEAMAHLQTTRNCQDMSAIETIQQFASVNQVTQSGHAVPHVAVHHDQPYSDMGSTMGSTTGSRFAMKTSYYPTSYYPGSQPAGVVAPSPS
jgi:hypothetical protein